MSEAIERFPGRLQRNTSCSKEQRKEIQAGLPGQTFADIKDLAALQGQQNRLTRCLALPQRPINGLVTGNLIR